MSSDTFFLRHQIPELRSLEDLELRQISDRARYNTFGKSPRMAAWTLVVSLAGPFLAIFALPFVLLSFFSVAIPGLYFVLLACSVLSTVFLHSYLRAKLSAPEARRLMEQRSS